MNRRRVQRLRLAVLAAAVLALEAACRWGGIASYTMIPPSEMADALVEMLGRPEVRADILQTLKLVAICLAIAVGCGIGLGVLLHLWPRLKRAAEPLLTSYYAVPIFVLYPTFIVLLGLGDPPLVAIGSLFAIIVMAVAALNGLERVPPVLLKAARMEGLSAAARVRHVLLPSALPHLVSGLKMALAYSFIGVIAGEFILSTRGIGHAIAYAYNDFDNRTMYGLLLFLVTLSTVVNLALHGLEQRMLRRWGRA